MPVHSFHLATTPVAVTAHSLLRPPNSETVPGLLQAECMMMMELGSSVFSPSRMQLRRFAMFAAWETEAAIDDFLGTSGLGASLAEGWHVRLEFLRRWGLIDEFDGLSKAAGESDPEAPVIAVTLARLKLPQVPRFIKWGKPVEELIRDHPATTLALAAMRPPRTVSTFSIWRSEREMTEMVHGTSPVDQPDRHAAAMVERKRKDFHHQFTTLRFRSVGEFGSYEGRTNIVPGAIANG